MKSIISLLLLGKELSAQSNHVSYTRPSAPMTLIYDSGDESFDAAPAFKIADIPITDSMSFSMDITVNSLYNRPEGDEKYAVLFECRNKADTQGWVRLPRIALNAEDNGYDGFQVIFGDWTNRVQETTVAEVGQPIHLELVVTQSTITVLQDDYRVEVDIDGHDVADSASCVVGPTWVKGTAADVTVSNLVIRSECADGYEFIDGICYADCPIGYTGSLHKCTSDEQWIDVRKYELLDDTPRTWDEAQSTCQERFGTDLASIHSMSDYDAALEICQSKGGDAHCYIGLRRDSDDETNWKWSDGSTVDYGSDFSGGVFPWSQGEPNYLKISGIGRPNEDCAEMVMPWDGEWNDIPCDGRLYALCNAVGSYEVLKTNTAIELFHNADGGLEVDAELRQQLVGSHCSDESSSSFGLIIGDLDDQKWHKIRYTIEFVSGSSACWSLFGDTKYGPFEDGDDFGLTTLNVIENGLIGGDWNGEKQLCNGEISNFMHGSTGNDYKGYLTVEQDRDLSVERAGISAGFSCISADQVVRVKDISVAYWRVESNPLFDDALTLGPNAEDVFGESLDIGEEAFNEMFAKSMIIKRECPACADTHKLIFYRRLSDIGDFNAYANMKNWRSQDNNMTNGDFALYSTLDDLIHDENRWTFCNYNAGTGVGFPRDCGPNGYVAWQWPGARGKQTKFSILNSELPDDEDIEWFNSYDYDNDELISFDEVIQGMDMDSEDKEKHSSELNKLFADMDTNNDGGGSLREMWQNDLPDREYIDDFNAIDVDGDGLISVDDAIQNLELDPQFIEEHRDLIIAQLSELFGEVDTDNDGVMSLSETFKYQEANQDDTSTTTTLAPIDDEDIE